MTNTRYLNSNRGTSSKEDATQWHIYLHFRHTRQHGCAHAGIIIIIKRISSALIYHTRWQHRALYSNINHTHTASDEGMGRAVKNSSEIIIKQVRLEGGFERLTLDRYY